MSPGPRTSAGWRGVAALAVGVAITLGACSGDGGARTSGPASGDRVPPGGQSGDKPPVASGEPEFRLEAFGTDPTQRLPRPKILLARTFREAGEVTDRAVVPGPATGLSSWDDFARRALVAVLAGPQPDSGYVVRITSVVIDRAGRALRINGRVVETRGDSEAVSVPWALLSIEAGEVVRVQRCILILAGRPPSRSNCR